jgi:hypothetical protein
VRCSKRASSLEKTLLEGGKPITATAARHSVRILVPQAFVRCKKLLVFWNVTLRSGKIGLRFVQNSEESSHPTGRLADLRSSGRDLRESMKPTVTGANKNGGSHSQSDCYAPDRGRKGREYRDRSSGTKTPRKRRLAPVVLEVDCSDIRHYSEAKR